MADLKNPRLILLKGFLFLGLGLLAAGLLIIERPEFRTVVLLGIAVWSFCRFYYFAFYVIQHYVDGNYRFAGLGSFLQYLWTRRKRATGPSTGVPPCETPTRTDRSDFDRSV